MEELPGVTLEEALIALDALVINKDTYENYLENWTEEDEEEIKKFLNS